MIAESVIETFDVRIEGAVDSYEVIADSSYGGTYRGRFVDPIDRADIARLQASLRRDAVRSGRDIGVVDHGSADAQVIIDRLGRTLFETAFSGELKSGLRDTMALAQRDGRQLRIRLRLESVPALGPLPWELLCDPERERFVALSGQTEIVRHLGRPEPVRSVAVAGPLRVLVVVSAPRDLPPISTEREWSALNVELAPLVETGRIELRRLRPATFAELRAALLEGPWHVLHFIGHGHHDPASLAFCDETGRAELVRAEALGSAFASTVELRLAVLNACHSARASERNAFGGVAQELLERSVPAVVAMQFAVSDTVAIEFAGRFYAAVTHGWPVDRAVGDARRTLADHSSEWVTPVTHMRGDGVLFETSTSPSPRPRRRRVLIAAATALAAAVAATTWVAVTRARDNAHSDTPLPPCPTVDASWLRPAMAAEPTGEHTSDSGPIDVTARSLASQPVSQGWLVVTDIAVTNRTADDFYLGDYRFPSLLVANRSFPITCYEGTDEAVEPGLTTDVRAGYQLSCEPIGLIELVTEDSSLALPLTADRTPSAC